jgi:hypothetical protein
MGRVLREQADREGERRRDRDPAMTKPKTTPHLKRGCQEIRHDAVTIGVDGAMLLP